MYFNLVLVLFLLPLLIHVFTIYFFNNGIGDGNRYWSQFANLDVWKSVLSYFPCKINYKTALDTNTQYIFASHPHGVISLHHLMYLTNGCKFHDVSSGGNRCSVVSPVLFHIPFIRHIMLWLGCIHPDKALVKKILQQGKSIVVLPGGMNELIRSSKGRNMIYIKKRLGFIKLALEFGTPIVPIYVFGENDLYDTVNILTSFRIWILDKFRISIVFPYGYLFFLPNRVPLNACVGCPIQVPKISKPTTDDIRKWHSVYVNRIQDIFNCNKTKFGYNDSILEVI